MIFKSLYGSRITTMNYQVCQFQSTTERWGSVGRESTAHLFLTTKSDTSILPAFQKNKTNNAHIDIESKNSLQGGLSALSSLAANYTAL